MLKCIAPYDFQFVVTKLLEKCREYVTTKQSSLTQWHPVLGWFSRPLDQHLNDALSTVKTQLQLLWSGPVIRVMFSTLTELVKDQVSFVLGKRGKDFFHFALFLFSLFFFFLTHCQCMNMPWHDWAPFLMACPPMPDAC